MFSLTSKIVLLEIQSLFGRNCEELFGKTSKDLVFLSIPYYAYA